ncbi:MAG: endonuclease/exonuclease/phosphatase family protein [Acetobacteraceae bacterium]
MEYAVAAWNIEKNGQSSTDVKQAKISEFIQFSCENQVHVIFLCEVHSARIDDYLSFCRKVYGATYHVDSLPGGHSNAYVVLHRNDLSVVPAQDTLKGLTRGAILLQLDNDLVLTLAHFKSGQTGLTKDQIQQAAGFLEGAKPGRWAIAGDMNWDYNNVGALTLPGGCHWGTCWTDQTQVHGGILDWCLAAGAITLKPMDCAALLPGEMNDMTGPDHRPVIFVLGPS